MIKLLLKVPNSLCCYKGAKMENVDWIPNSQMTKVRGASTCPF